MPILVNLHRHHLHLHSIHQSSTGNGYTLIHHRHDRKKDTSACHLTSLQCILYHSSIRYQLAISQINCSSFLHPPIPHNLFKADIHTIPYLFSWTQRTKTSAGSACWRGKYWLLPVPSPFPLPALSSPKRTAARCAGSGTLYLPQWQFPHYFAGRHPQPACPHIRYSSNHRGC